MNQFDHINDPDIVKRITVERETSFAIVNQMPITPGHTLICPKRHVAKSADLTPEEWADIFALKEIVCRQLETVLGAEGYNFAWNEGEMAGQSVPHFHLHIVPRKKGDVGITQYEPRVFLYRPDSDREISPQEEIYSLAVLLRNS